MHNNVFYLISKKYRINQPDPKFSNYEKIQIDKIYKIEIEEIKDVPIIHIRAGINNFHIDEELFDKNDKIKLKVYKSKNIYTKYIELL